MHINESLISSLRSGKTRYEYGVCVNDLISALMFLNDRESITIQVYRRETIPYVRRLLFALIGEPSFESQANMLRYRNPMTGGFNLIRILHYKDAQEHKIVGMPTQDCFYVSTNDEELDWSSPPSLGWRALSQWGLYARVDKNIDEQLVLHTV
jgi:hypothetical protein